MRSKTWSAWQCSVGCMDTKTNLTSYLKSLLRFMFSLISWHTSLWWETFNVNSCWFTIFYPLYHKLPYVTSWPKFLSPRDYEWNIKIKIQLVIATSSYTFKNREKYEKKVQLIVMEILGRVQTLSVDTTKFFEPYLKRTHKHIFFLPHVLSY